MTSLLSQAPRFFIKRVNFLAHPIRLGFLRVCLAQLFSAYSTPEFVCFSHIDLYR
jgi:hypothetical protein